jgi:hypothetical protein
MFDPTLARALRFTEADLTANRRGWITPRQERLLRLPITLSGAAVVVGLGVTPITLWGLLPALGAAGYLAYRVRGSGMLGPNGWRTPQVRALTGHITLDQRLRGGRCRVDVAGERFVVPQALLRALRPRASYVVYVAARYGVVISAEAA